MKTGLVAVGEETAMLDNVMGFSLRQRGFVLGRRCYPRQRRAYEPDRVIVDPWAPGRVLDRHPNARRHLQSELVELQRRHRADDALGYERRFGQPVAGITDPLVAS